MALKHSVLWTILLEHRNGLLTEALKEVSIPQKQDFTEIKTLKVMVAVHNATLCNDEYLLNNVKKT